MGALEHFNQMPLGVKILFAISLLALVSSIASIPIMAVLLSKPNMLLYSLLSLAAVVLVALTVYGIWKQKKFVKTVYLLFTVLGIIQFFVIPSAMPTIIHEQIKQLSAPEYESLGIDLGQLEERTVQFSIVFSQFAMATSIIMYLIFFWYVTKKKEYFVN